MQAELSVVWFTSGPYFPAMQSMQVELPVDVSYFPMGQALHSASPPGEYLPIEQSMQVSLDCSVWSLYFPLTQEMQPPNPRKDHFPAEQFMQLVATALLLYFPGWQYGH